jgi:hypothetical protein
MIEHDPKSEDREAARKKYMPEKIRRLLVAEAPPENVEQFFYFEKVAEGDQLYLETMKVVFGNVDISDLRQRKAEFLQGFKDAGFYLIDAVDEPIPQNASSHERRDLIWNNRNNLIWTMRSLVDSRTDVILIKSTVYDLHDVLRKNDFHIINEDAIEFPSNGHQKQFRDKLTLLLRPYFDEEEGDEWR